MAKKEAAGENQAQETTAEPQKKKRGRKPGSKNKAAKRGRKPGRKATGGSMTAKLLVFFDAKSKSSDKDKAKYLGFKPADYKQLIMDALKSLAMESID